MAHPSHDVSHMVSFENRCCSAQEQNPHDDIILTTPQDEVVLPTTLINNTFNHLIHKTYKNKKTFENQQLSQTSRKPVGMNNQARRTK